MALHTEEAGLCPDTLCMRAYDDRTKAAVDRWFAELPPAVHLEARCVLEDGAELASKRWQSWCREVEPSAGEAQEQGEGNPLTGHGQGVVGAVGTEDDEHPAHAPRSAALHLQQRLIRIVDRCAAEGLVVKLIGEERHGDLQRLSDMSSKEANHDWLWSVDPHKAKRLDHEEYVSAVRLRLGCGGPPDPEVCGNCNSAMIGCNGEHGLLCAKGESTRGHNAIRDELHSIAAPIDRAAEMEPEGLIASCPRLRPADVLTGAFHNGRLAAVDVGVICPSASGAGLDCVSTMHERKHARMRPFGEELGAGAIEYHPFAVSCWGRLHPSALQMLENVAKRMARREGNSSQRAILGRLVARITTEVMRRAARMVLQCRPRAVYLGENGDADAVVDPLCPHAQWRAGDPGTMTLPPYAEIAGTSATSSF